MLVHKQLNNKLFLIKKEEQNSCLLNRLNRKTKVLFALILLALVFYFQFIPFLRVHANLDDSIFIIKETWPANGSTNIPVDLKSGLTGSSYSNPPGIGNIAIGYGTDLSGGCGDPPNCPSISDIKSDSINSSTITISSSNDPDIVIKYHGGQECYGECYGSDSFYHNFSVIPINSALPSGIKLMPQTTYTITIKGGDFGIVATRSTVSGDKDVYLSGDYSWSFTTGDGEIPLRQVPTATTAPTSIPVSTNTPSSTIVSNDDQESNDSNSPNDTLLNSTPTPSTIQQPTQQQKKTAIVKNTEITVGPTSESSDSAKKTTLSPTGSAIGVSSSSNNNLKTVIIVVVIGILMTTLFLKRNVWLRSKSFKKSIKFLKKYLKQS